MSKCGAQHDDVQLGLFYAVLIDPKSAPQVCVYAFKFDNDVIKTVRSILLNKEQERV